MIREIKTCGCVIENARWVARGPSADCQTGGLLWLDDGSPMMFSGPSEDAISGGGTPAIRDDAPASPLPTDSAARKAVPIATGFFDYFPNAIAAIAELSKLGNDKHNPGQPLHWAFDKSNDHADCLLRHFVDRGVVDPSSGLSHTVSVAWRALALLETELIAAGAPKGRGVK